MAGGHAGFAAVALAALVVVPAILVSATLAGLADTQAMAA
jgi:hypothetical protein